MKENKLVDNLTEISKISQENFVRDNNVYILGPFDRSISSKVIPDLNDLISNMKFAKEPEINFYINSYGGYSAELLSIMTFIQLAKSYGIKINTYNLGTACSCGSILAVLGTHRYMYRYACNMPHLGSAGLEAQTFEQLERGTKRIGYWFSMIVEIYSDHTKMPKKMLDKVLKDDDYCMYAEECLRYGFCDEVI